MDFKRTLDDIEDLLGRIMFRIENKGDRLSLYEHRSLNRITEMITDLKELDKRKLKG